MCGFTGFFAKNNALSRSEMHDICQRMTDSLTHRGPDADGVWQDPDIALVLGHRRLSILDLSDEGAQPMESASGRYIIAYNGEIYNFPDLKADLENKGAVFRGRSDTEVILSALDEYGLNQTIQKLNGMFAFALFDRQSRILHFARDRMGKKPLYVGWAGKNLVFGSELKALRTHPDFEAKINRDTLALYLQKAYVPSPHCIYQDVWGVPAGHILSLDLNSITAGENLAEKMDPYWHHLDALEAAKDHGDSFNETGIVEKFDALLTQCTQDRLISDVPLGAFLSGGIDSSAIVALMQKLSNSPVKTYSIGFEESGFNEAPYAKSIAEHLGTDHHEMYVSGQDALNVIPDLGTIYDEPFGDISAIPTYLVSKFARDNVTVALSGDGGDEMLGGYNRHIYGPAIWNKIRIVPESLRSIAGSVIKATPISFLDKAFKKQPQFGTRIHKMAGMMGLSSEREIYEQLSSQWHEPPALDAKKVQTFMDRSDYQPQNLSFAEAMMYWDALTYLPGDILTKVDRASMAVGLECRAPLLDQRIYDFAWALPEHYKIRKTENGITGKWLLREMLKTYVPDHLFERPKQGFAMPVGDWLRGDLRDWAQDLLNETSLAEDGLLDATTIRAAWDTHLKGSGNHADALWNVLMFQSWKQEWM